LDVVSDNGDAESDDCPRGRWIRPAFVGACLRLLGTPTRQPGGFASRSDISASDFNAGALADSFAAHGFRTVDSADPRLAMRAVP
jgi:hypothetical protein